MPPNWQGTGAEIRNILTRFMIPVPSRQYPHVVSPLSGFGSRFINLIGVNFPPMPADSSNNDAAEAAILLNAIGSMEEAFVAYDAEGRPIVCNQAFRDMYNYTEAKTRPGVHFSELGEIDVQQGNFAIGDDIGADYLERKRVNRKNLKGSFYRSSEGRPLDSKQRPAHEKRRLRPGASRHHRDQGKQSPNGRCTPPSGDCEPSEERIPGDDEL